MKRAGATVDLLVGEKLLGCVAEALGNNVRYGNGPGGCRPIDKLT